MTYSTIKSEINYWLNQYKSPIGLDQDQQKKNKIEAYQELYKHRKMLEGINTRKGSKKEIEIEKILKTSAVVNPAPRFKVEVR